jgi:hypothetical protein
VCKVKHMRARGHLRARLVQRGQIPGTEKCNHASFVLSLEWATVLACSGSSAPAMVHGSLAKQLLQAYRYEHIQMVCTLSLQISICQQLHTSCVAVLRVGSSSHGFKSWCLTTIHVLPPVEPGPPGGGGTCSWQAGAVAGSRALLQVSTGTCKGNQLNQQD